MQQLLNSRSLDLGFLFPTPSLPSVGLSVNIPKIPGHPSSAVGPCHLAALGPCSKKSLYGD